MTVALTYDVILSTTFPAPGTVMYTVLAGLVTVTTPGVPVNVETAPFGNVNVTVRTASLMDVGPREVVLLVEKVGETIDVVSLRVEADDKVLLVPVAMLVVEVV